MIETKALMFKGFFGLDKGGHYTLEKMKKQFAKLNEYVNHPFAPWQMQAYLIERCKKLFPEIEKNIKRAELFFNKKLTEEERQQNRKEELVPSAHQPVDYSDWY